MDVRYFLERRLAFIEQLYTNAATPFVQQIRKIDAEEEPFVPPYSEDGGEPAFLSEWVEARESLQVLGHSCLSMVSASFHLYFKTLERECRVPVDESIKPVFRQRGWMNGYSNYFASLGVRFEESPCDLTLLEELALARNRVQHPEEITTHESRYSVDDLKKVPSPFFVDDREAAMLADAEDGERSWLIPPTIHVTAAKLSAAIHEVRRFAKWLEGKGHG